MTREPRQSISGMTFGAVLFLLFTPGCAMRPGEPQPLCVLEPAGMPASWRPAGAVQKSLSAAPWSQAETKDAAFAVSRGLDELSDYYSKRPSAIVAIGDNAVESLIDASYAAGNMPALRDRARDNAREVLAPLLAPYLQRASNSITCHEYPAVVTYAGYAHTLLPAGDIRIQEMAERANVAFHACGTIEKAMGSDYRRTLAVERPSVDDLFDLVMWSVTLTDAQTVPGLEVPSEASALPPTLWRVLARYRYPNARSFPEGARNKTFYDAAYLATHAAYIPTGYGRHPIYVGDDPNLYRFLRENFYAVLELGELDLESEFVDLFRQYGCTEENDLQLRDGTRYLLKLFHAAGGNWMAHREPRESTPLDDYTIVHKAWTGMAGVRVRIPEPPAPGTYGGVVRQWLGYPR